MLLTIRNLSIRFEPRNLPPELLLDNVCLTLIKGKVHFLLGGNGTGKTSFLKTMVGLLPENSAHLDRCIELPNGSAISGVELPKRIKVGYIPQNPHEALVPNFNVSENISFRSFLRNNVGLSDWLIKQRYGKAVQEKIKLSINSFDIAKNILSEKLHSEVAHLSGGEQQILNLASMIFDDCELLMMDEPTSKLDVSNRNRFWDFIKDIKGKRDTTMLIVTHDALTKEIREIADRVFTIAGSSVREIQR
jgi:ABC-type multidrug transport system ATPase subunit